MSIESETELCFTPASELASLIHRGKLSPVELVDAVLLRIERVDPEVNAYCLVDAEQARADAARAEATITADQPVGPLHGVWASPSCVDRLGQPRSESTDDSESLI